ncbi:hypothetical protein BLA29_009932 [Euroglyphus maynei]|uniref:Uncharacterized protein n=1 Tax=Euroglyphus maynei TaxID=6958 RepID=A0A1Y3B4A6_EURMA|nr:hypothetical protein BLA29_009932 [Euroglyphus maynei]
MKRISKAGEASVTTVTNALDLKWQRATKETDPLTLTPQRLALLMPDIFVFAMRHCTGGINASVPWPFKMQAGASLTIENETMKECGRFGGFNLTYVVGGRKDKKGSAESAIRFFDAGFNSQYIGEEKRLRFWYTVYSRWPEEWENLLSQITYHANLFGVIRSECGIAQVPKPDLGSSLASMFLSKGWQYPLNQMMPPVIKTHSVNGINSSDNNNNKL